MNGGTDELRYYGSSGTYLYSVGRDGFGPGECKDTYDLWFVRDSLVVFDWGQDRVSVFSASDEYGRTLMLDRALRARPGAAGVFSDGWILGTEFVFRGGSGFRQEETEQEYRRHSPDGLA